MKKMISGILAVMLVFSLGSSALADSNRVDVQWFICAKDSYVTDYLSDLEAGLANFAGPLHKPLVLVLPEGHGDMYIRLTTTGGFGFTIDGFAAVTSAGMYSQLMELLSGTAVSTTADLISLFESSVKKAKFCVDMYDENQEHLWGEVDAIETNYSGGTREFFCGENVKYITVYSWYDLGPGEVFKVLPFPARVAYENARLAE